MAGEYLVSTDITAPVQALNKPTQFSSGPDSTTRTVELDKGMTQPTTSRETASSITLGGM